MEVLCETDSILTDAATLVLHSLINSSLANDERKRRQSILDWIDSLCVESIGLRSVSIGAVVSNTSVLIGHEDLQLTLFFDKNDTPHNDQWFLSLYAALCKHSQASKPLVSVDRISYFLKEQRLETVTDGILVRITPNDIGSLTFASLLEDFDRTIGGESLLKRSILLIKAWCVTEVPHLRPAENCAALQSFLHLLSGDKVIEVMVMALFASNIFTEEPVHEPIKVLLRFLEIFSRLEWNRWAVSVCGIIALPSPCTSPAETDVGTETDSPLSSSIPSPLSSSSCESTGAYHRLTVGDPILTAIAVKYRKRLSLTRCCQEDNEGPVRLQSTDTDHEDCSLDGRQCAPTREDKVPKEAIGIKRGPSPCIEEEKVTTMYGQIHILDPTKFFSNLCSFDSALTQGRSVIQELFKSVLGAGLEAVKHTLEANEPLSVSPSCFISPKGSQNEVVEVPMRGGEKVIRIVSGIFPVLSKTQALIDEMATCTNGGEVAVDGSAIISLLRSDPVKLLSDLTQAEVAMGINQLETINTTAAASLLNQKEQNNDIDSISSVFLSTCPTIPDVLDAHDTHDTHMSEISFSKSFSSFDSDCSKFSINLVHEVAPEAARRFLSLASPLETTPSASYDAYVPSNQHTLFVGESDNYYDNVCRETAQQFLEQPSRGLITRSNSACDVAPATNMVGGEVYHQYQKTLMRHQQSISHSASVGSGGVSSGLLGGSGGVGGGALGGSGASRPPAVIIPWDTSPAGYKDPSTTPPTGAPKLAAPFIQPFVVKEMQVWVPGKFGASGGSTASVSTKTPVSPAVTKQGGGVGGFNKVGSGSGGGGGGGYPGHPTGPLAGRYSPIAQGNARPIPNYMHGEEEHDGSWVEIPDDGSARMRTNRMALAGHQQMQLRDRQAQTDRLTERQDRQTERLAADNRQSRRHSDHHIPPQYAGPPRTAERMSPHSLSPPISASPYPSVVKRPPVSISAAIAQTNRLNYGMTSMANSAPMSRTSLSPSLGGGRDVMKESSPTSFMRGGDTSFMRGGGDVSEFDSWSLTSQHVRQPDVNFLSSSIASRPIGLCDPHTSEQRRVLQQLQQQQSASEKARYAQSAAMKVAKSEAQLPSFLRDL